MQHKGFQWGVNKPEKPEEKWTIAKIRACNWRSGQYWFHPDTIKYYKTKLYTVEQGVGGVYFVYSNTAHDEADSGRVARFDPCNHTICVVELPAHIENNYQSVWRYARELAKNAITHEVK